MRVVPVSAALMSRGVTPAAAIAFLLSAPAINPVVLASTAVAFPGQPRVVVARLVCSLAVSMLLGWLWLATGKGRSWLKIPATGTPRGRPSWRSSAPRCCTTSCTPAASWWSALPPRPP
jgi:uncharacterized membrane protein YraQ (UPF0718 family)